MNLSKNLKNITLYVIVFKKNYIMSFLYSWTSFNCWYPQLYNKYYILLAAVDPYSETIVIDG